MTTTGCDAQFEARDSARPGGGGQGFDPAALAHCIRNHLNLWDSSARLIDRKLAEGDLEAARRVWPIMKRTGGHVGRLVRNLLTLTSGCAADPAPGDLNALVEEILEEARPRAEEIGVRVERGLWPGLPPARFDPAALRGAIINLLVNAFDALETVERGKRRVRVATGAVGRGQWAWLAIDDSGPGIDPALVPRLFEPGFTTKGGNGAGLGLAVVRSVVERHGGRVQVQSEPGRGARFYIELPAENHRHAGGIGRFEPE